MRKISVDLMVASEKLESNFYFIFKRKEVIAISFILRFKEEYRKRQLYRLVKEWLWRPTGRLI